MKVKFLISTRFLKPKNKKSNFSLMTIISILGISLGVMVPIIVLSVLVGFQEEIKTKILGVKGHLVITKDDNTYIKDYQNFIKDLKEENSEIVSAVPYIEVQGMAQFYNNFEPILVRGVDETSFTDDQEMGELFTIKRGERDLAKTYSTLIGEKLASNYFIKPNDRLKLFVVEKNSLSLNIQPTPITTVVKGTFETGFQDFDIGVIYVSLKTLQKKFRRPNQVKSIDVKIDNVWQIDKLKNKLVEKYGKDYSFYTWQEINFNFFKALTLEKTLMYLIMSLILLVAVFNVTSSQLVMIVERKREIGILKTIGMKASHLVQIFLIQGSIISSLGAFLGGILGYLISLEIKILISAIEYIINFFSGIAFLITSVFFENQEFVPFEFFPKGIYYLNTIPSDVSISRVVFFMSIAIVLSLICSLIASFKAARLKPIENIRYE